VFAGNLGAAQSLTTLLSAAELTRERGDIKWIVFGDGRERKWLEAEIERRGLGANLVLMGSRPAPEMPRYFAVADVLLVTLRKSPIFALTIPSKVQSYLACGRPIIAAVEGEGARVVEEALAGVACPAESPQALADTVVRLSRTSAEERRIMGENGRRYFDKEFGRDMLLGRLELLLAKSRVGGVS
jgi:glycosyltransferase involved in cell wall biosynthesis